MHISQRFASVDAEESLRFINDVRFGTLVTRVDGRFDATPIPWVAERSGETIVLWGHLANANPQLDEIRKSADVLLTFTGVNGYISPRVLPTPHSAPTWNYIAAHVHGSCKTLDGADTEFAVQKLVTALESCRPDPWTMAEMGPRRKKLLRHITGVRVVADRIDAKFKLGQNESDVDLRAILESLDADNSRELLDAMRTANLHRKNIFPGAGE